MQKKRHLKNKLQLLGHSIPSIKDYVNTMFIIKINVELSIQDNEYTKYTK
jgi:hypothetical protein